MLIGEVGYEVVKGDVNCFDCYLFNCYSDGIGNEERFLWGMNLNWLDGGCCFYSLWIWGVRDLVGEKFFVIFDVVGIFNVFVFNLFWWVFVFIFNVFEVLDGVGIELKIFK